MAGYFEGDFDCFNPSNGTFYGETGHLLKTEISTGNKSERKLEMQDSSGHKIQVLMKEGEIMEPASVYSEKLNPSIKKCISLNICTRAYTKKVFYPQIYYHVNLLPFF